MRKHNRIFAKRMPRGLNKDGTRDRSNAPQKLAHELTNSKPFQLAMNRNLNALLSTVGCNQPALTL